jgi:hypothetical protein
MNPIITYDAWLREKVADALDWIYEWLAVSQKMIERGLIGVYATASAVLVFVSVKEKQLHILPPWGWMLMQLVMIAILVSYHRDPSAVRRVKHLSKSSCMMRMYWQYIAVIVFLPPYHLFDIALIVLDPTWLVFLYVVAANCDGERGRRAKLAWSKLKELFTWLPDPVPEGV